MIPVRPLGRLDARADVLAKYGEAPILEMLVKVLPDAVGAAAAPLSSVGEDGVTRVPITSDVAKSNGASA